MAGRIAARVPLFKPLRRPAPSTWYIDALSAIRSGPVSLVFASLIEALTPRRIGALALACACTPAPAPGVEPSPSPPPPAPTPALVDPGPRAHARILDGHVLATHCRDVDEPITTLVRTGPAGQVWATSLSEEHDATSTCKSSMMVAAGRTLVVALGSHRASGGAVGIDLDSGEIRWTTAFYDSSEVSHAAAGDEYALLAFYVPQFGRTSGPSDRVLHVYAARTGARTRIELPGRDQYVPMASGVALSTGGTGRGPSPWQLRLASDPGSPRPFGELSTACAVDDRLYGLTAAGLVRQTIALPAEELTPVWQGDETRVVSCERHGGDDIVWLTGQILGVAPRGDVLWTIELGPWIPTHRGSPGAALPATIAVAARHDRAHALLFIDLERHELRRIVDTSGLYSVWTDSDEQRSHITIQPRRDGETVLAVVDARGELTAAVGIRDEDRLHLLDRDAWYASRLDLFAVRERPDAGRKLYLDGATLTSLAPLRDPLPDALAQARTLLRRDFVPAPPRGPPPRPTRRGGGSGPPWDAASLLGAARADAGAGLDAPAHILLWDRHRERGDGWSEHALVVVEQPDRRGRPTWVATLWRRGNRDDWALPHDPDYYAVAGRPTRVRAYGVDVWHAFERDDRTRQTRRYWRRPSDADLQRLLASNGRWDFSGAATTAFIEEAIGRDERAVVVDGNVIDAAWRALTGEPPTRHYAAGIERPD